MAFHRWLYQGGRPNTIAKILNAGWGFLHAIGIAPGYMITLEVAGRQSGKPIRFPLAMVHDRTSRSRQTRPLRRMRKLKLPLNSPFSR